ncbi:hypothetical protein J4573_30615 [Actinomadura barringtoniae]|uniref:Secreted protein n=1 Tax=Actinomadura barringtoniae TaxID=1427535 RepID=A0A939T701_9ACTN|nr:hypothetical protein [Actinomadura barringtoniae]MBO2451479.1 hypothetical protein [Actinomadura barringtoniae]
MTRLSPRTLRRIVTVGTVPVVAAGAILAVTAAPALAQTECGPNKEQTAPVGGHALLRACIQKDGNQRRAYIQLQYARTYGGKDWDKFVVHVRLERNDADKEYGSCDWTSDMNNYKTLNQKCYTDWYISGTTGGWTGDGYYVYNYNLDGLGDKSASLTGSPKVS